MKTKKTGQLDTEKLHEFFLINDCGDLKFSLFLGPKSSDNWITYYCSLSLLDDKLGTFQEIYSSNKGSVVSDISFEEILELKEFLKAVLDSKGEDGLFEAGNKDFSLNLAPKGDFYKVEAAIDLFTMNPEKLSGGHGDSIVSLKFSCTRDDLVRFSDGLQNWPNTKSGD